MLTHWTYTIFVAEASRWNARLRHVIRSAARQKPPASNPSLLNILLEAVMTARHKTAPGDAISHTSLRIVKRLSLPPRSPARVVILGDYVTNAHSIERFCRITRLGPPILRACSKYLPWYPRDPNGHEWKKISKYMVGLDCAWKISHNSEYYYG